MFNENTQPGLSCSRCVLVREREELNHCTSELTTMTMTTMTAATTTTTNMTTNGGSDYHGINRPKGIKIQTKNAHTRYEIYSNNNSLARTNTLYTLDCRYQMCIWQSDVCPLRFSTQWK